MRKIINFQGVQKSTKFILRATSQKYSTSEKIEFSLDKSQFKTYTPEGEEFSKFGEGPNLTASFEKEKLIDMYKLMVLVRRTELAAEKAYKERKIRGFLHLYNGQEAVCVGIEEGTTKEDHIVTAYRDHGYQLCRGDTAESVLAELFGKAAGCSKGKGGSMHMYLRKNGFFGGNGIVGAQVPLGAGLAYALKYQDKKNCALTLYGDGASNQGQVFEAYNMAALWKLPCIFVCEDNRYGMGTSTKRSSASQAYYKRADYIPGLKVDGMDVIAVAEATRFAKDWAVNNGPVLLHMETYRYFGHSMSDPGVTYRTREEVQSVRKLKDPINSFRDRLVEKSVFTAKDAKDIEKVIRNEVDKAVKFADETRLPDESELISDVLVDSKYTVKGTSASKVFHYQKQ